MSDLISREDVMTIIARKHLFKDKNDFDKCVHIIARQVKNLPSADILDHARAIKEYCRDRNSLDEPCEGCPFHFYVGYRGYCRFESLPAEWDLPEGEKE